MLSIGVDVGGTKTSVALVDVSDGLVLRMATIPSDPQLGARELGRRINGLIADFPVGCARPPVGLALPELVSPEGRVLTDVVIPGLLGDPADALDLQLRVVESDVRAAAVGEARYGSGRGLTSFAYLSIGTGIAHCFVRDGEPWGGARGAAILIGSGIPVDPRIDTGGRVVPLEAWASGTGLVARANSRGLKVNRGQEVLSRALGGDRAAVASVAETGRAAGLAVSVLVNLFDPQAVVVGGGLGSADGPFWDALLEGAAEGIWSGTPWRVPVIHAGTGVAAGAIGAAALAAEGRP